MFSRLNMCRSQGAHDRILQGRQAEQTHLSLCSEVYDYQVVNGRHFHMEQPQGSEVFEEALSERLHESSMKLWTPDTAARDTTISRLKGPSDT